jgi:Arc/MetJ family transcription regulator
MGGGLCARPLAALRKEVQYSENMCIFRLIIHKVFGEIMRTNIVIDDKLMSVALKTSGLKTKKEVVEEGLRLLVKVKNQSKLKKLRGKLKWEGNLEEMRIDK